MQTIEEAKIQLRKDFVKGSVCPCCNQLVKLYKRTINSSMAVCLIQLSRLAPDGDFIHIQQLSKATGNAAFFAGDFAKLRFWELTEKSENTDPDKKTSGEWRITPKGIKFVGASLSVKKHALIYNQTVLGFEGDEVTIKDCLAKKFSYAELMGHS